MATQKTIVDVFHIAAADLYNYTLKVIEAKEQGFEPTTNMDHFPRCVGSLFVANLVKYEETEIEEAPVKPNQFAVRNADGISDLQKQKDALEEMLGEQAGKAVEELKAAEPDLPKRGRGRKG